MRLYRKKGSSYYYVDLRSVGDRQRCTFVTDRGSAKAIGLRWQQAVAEGRSPEDPEAGRTVAEACQLLLDSTTSRSLHYEYRCGHIIRLMGGVRLSSLSTADVSRFLKRRHQQEGAAASTVEKDRKALGRALRLAKKEGWWRGDLELLMPDDWHAPYQARERRLELEEAPKLLAQLAPRRQRWVLIAIYTGGRRSEVDALRWEHLDWARRQVHLHGTKTGGARRIVPLVQPLEQLLQAMRPDWRTAKGEVLGEWAPGPLGRRWSSKWQGVLGGLARACKRAGIDKVTPNDLRRTYASWLADTGATEGQTARLLGHASTEMVRKVYVRHGAKALAERAGALPAMGVNAAGGTERGRSVDQSVPKPPRKGRSKPNAG